MCLVGGGTAGSIMASRLSQHPCLKILLLEAGGEQPILTYVPGLSRAFLGTSIDWSYFTAPQNYSAFGQKENVSHEFTAEISIFLETK